MDFLPAEQNVEDTIDSAYDSLTIIEILDSAHRAGDLVTARRMIERLYDLGDMHTRAHAAH